LLPLLYLSANGSLNSVSENASLRLNDPSATGFVHYISVAALLTITAALVASRFRSTLTACRRHKLLLALPALALLSSLWSDQSRQSLISGTILLAITVLAVYIGCTMEPVQQFELLIFMGSIAMATSVGAIVFVPSYGLNEGFWRGIFQHKNNCGGVATLFLVSALHWAPRRKSQRIARWLYLISCLVFVAMAQSRTGWGLCLVAVSLTWTLWILRRLKAKDALVIAMTFTIALGGAVLGLYYSASALLELVGKDQTLSQRTIIWAACWEAIQSHFVLGYGYAGFWSGLTGPSINVVLTAGWTLWQAQDGYLDVWLQLGVFGIGVLVLILVASARDAFLTFRAKDDSNYVRWCIVVMVSVLMYNIGETSIILTHLVWVLFLVAAAGLAETRRRGRLSI
jgi:O-antigen ligase